MDNVYSGYPSRSYWDDGDEVHLTPEQVQAYFTMLKEVEWGYKGKAIITSYPPMEHNHFYDLFMSQANREN